MAETNAINRTQGQQHRRQHSDDTVLASVPPLATSSSSTTSHDSIVRHETSRAPGERTLSKKYESLDYDLVENVIYLEHMHKARIKGFISRDFQRWLVIFLIGFTTAMSGFFAAFLVKFLSTVKFSQVIHAAENQCPQVEHPNIMSYLQMLKCMAIPSVIWLSWNVIPSLVGSLMVTYIAPVAAGSGIPVVKCYLNGVKIPEVVRFKTYVAKLLGVICSVVGGLASGKEGPFIHVGAAIGAGLSQGKSTTFRFDSKLFKTFRNDRDKRDFVSAGASAGVAAAFGAPIGGVLFALEEGASFWNQALTWRIFFGSMMTSFILNLFMSAYNNNAGVLAFYSLVNFGLVEELDYFWFEIPVYICIAIAGGAAGASFCYANLLITRLRQRYLVKRWMKVIETVIVAVLATALGISLIIFAPECRKLPDTHITVDPYNSSGSYSAIPFGFSRYDLRRLWSPGLDERDYKAKHPATYTSDDELRKALNGHILTFMCPPGEYSAMSSLWLKTSEQSASTFMVMQEEIWSVRTLALFCIVYYVLAVLTYGLSISSGVFIPALLIGATGGRMVGLILRNCFGPLEWLKQLNKFAIIGAASTLGGVVRMTISLTVIIIEATGCISFGLPIMICLMISKWVADSFIHGLYDLAIHLANVPFLDWEPPLKSYSIYASDVMSPGVRVLRTTETVANLINILESTTHNGFPVVDLDETYESPNSSVRGSKPIPESTLNATKVDRVDANDQNPSKASRRQSNLTEVRNLVQNDSLAQEYENSLDDDHMIGSYQRCSITAKRESYGRFRGLVLRWQILMMLHLKIFNENERSYERLTLPSFQSPYPRYPSLEKVIAGLTSEMYNFHIDLRSIMNPTPYSVLYSASFPRIYRVFRSLGLRHLIVIDDRNQVVGMITRKDLARYVRERDKDGTIRFHELPYGP